MSTTKKFSRSFSPTRQVNKLSVGLTVICQIAINGLTIYIDGVLSNELPVNFCVLQGLILGLLFYVIYTSDLPETVHKNHASGSLANTEADCRDCGSLCCYADDSTYTVSDEDINKISSKITEKYNEISEYMNNNRLILNSDKTRVLVMASSHKHKKYGNFGIELNTGTEVIQPVECEVLLGATLTDNFQWNYHIRDGENALVKSLSRKNTALGRISKIADFKTRKMIGSGLIMSTISYIIQVYGSCSSYLLDTLQVQQNISAKHITKLPFMTPTYTLLKQCDWLSVRQMIVYFSLILLHKAFYDRKPEYIYEKIKPTRNLRETRTIDRLSLEIRRFKTSTASKSFIS